jgi:citrate synthase
MSAPQRLHTRIWQEEPEPDNAFAARAAFCHGYDVYGEMLGRVRWADMLYLLFRGEAPTQLQAELLDALATALANPGPRDAAVHAAMCGGVGGSPAAASLIAALAVGAGRHGGAHEVFDAMQRWSRCGTELSAWIADLRDTTPSPIDIWPDAEHPAGFEAHGVSTPTIVRQTLETLACIGGTPSLAWLAMQRCELETTAGLPLSMSGVAAAALTDLGFTPREGEMLHLLLRLPGAAAHALEQQAGGFKRFPFYPVLLEDDPAALPSREAAT